MARMTSKHKGSPSGWAFQLVEKWPVWLHNQTGRKVNEG